MSALVPAESSGTTAIGRPFPKGKSGNPGGRPKGSDALRTRIIRETKAGAEVVTYLLEAMRHSRSGKERIDAATLLLAYGFGKPVQPTDVSADVSGAVTVRVVYVGAQIDDEDGDGRD